MTDLQRRMHETVCLPSGLTACLCGAYARVGEEYARDRVAGYVKGIDEFCALANQTQARLDAATKRETRLREALTALSHYVEHHVVMPLHRHADYPLIGDCTKLCDEHADSLGREVVAKLAALSAGAGEK